MPLAPSLVAFRSEVNARWPNRDKSSDGWIGDTAHATRPSDHNPGARDLVHAFDLDEDLNGDQSDAGPELQWLVNHLVKVRDPRVSYLIYEGRMWRSYSKPGIPAWTPAPYTGINAHRHHLHISILSTVAAEQDTRPWLPQEDDMTIDELLKALQRGPVRDEFKEITQGAGLDALRAKTETRPDRGAWRAEIEAIVREVLAGQS